MEFNLKYVKEFLASEEGQKYRRENGWCLLVGAPTGCLFLPLLWCVEKETPFRWKSISGFPYEKFMMLCTSKNLHEQFKKIEDNVFKAVAWAPVNIYGIETQQPACCSFRERLRSLSHFYHRYSCFSSPTQSAWCSFQELSRSLSLLANVNHAGRAGVMQVGNRNAIGRQLRTAFLESPQLHKELKIAITNQLWSTRNRYHDV